MGEKQKSANVLLMSIDFFYTFFPNSYILDYAGSIETHIKTLQKMKNCYVLDYSESIDTQKKKH